MPSMYVFLFYYTFFFALKRLALRLDLRLALRLYLLRLDMNLKEEFFTYKGLNSSLKGLRFEPLLKYYDWLMQFKNKHIYNEENVFLVYELVFVFELVLVFE